MRSLSGSVQAEVLPANILAKADRMIVWWTPTRRRQMFYENSEGKAAELNGRIFPQPPLVWRVSHGELTFARSLRTSGPRVQQNLPSRHFGISLTMGTYAPAPCVARTAQRLLQFRPGRRLLRERLHARQRWPPHAP